MGWFEFFALVILAGIVALYLLVRAVSSSSRRSDEVYDRDARTIQELHAQLKTMEERVETLETLLLEEEKRRSSRDNFVEEKSYD